MKIQSGFAKPTLWDSQLKFRLNLIRQRLTRYPMDDINFVLIDLERPQRRRRHADFCTYDITGRSLFFYALADGIDGERDPRMDEIYRRVMNNRRRSGAFGRVWNWDEEPSENAKGVGNHFLSGLCAHYEVTGDLRALEAARQAADWALSFGDEYFAPMKSAGAHNMSAWAVEGFAWMYRVTRDEKYLNACRRIARECMGSVFGAHSHGYLTTLRGILLAAMESGDEELTRIVRARRQEIFDIGGVLPGGDICESFPRSDRNEGCSIADWVMLNLMWAHHAGDEEAYAIAEHSLYNALFFNQFITGAFGHRYLAPRGYRPYVEEAWWCCTQDAGLCFATLSRHIVTVREGNIHINFLIPGSYELPDGVKVTIATTYPARPEAVITVTGTKADVSVRLPRCIHTPTLARQDLQDGYVLRLGGRMGHYTQDTPEGRQLFYGPMLLAPMIYRWNMASTAMEGNTVPEGYLKDNLPACGCEMLLPEPDADGLLTLPKEPRPMWFCFEEGEMARLPGGEEAAVPVPVRFADGSEKTLYFHPLCIATSNLTLMDVPVTLG